MLCSVCGYEHKIYDDGYDYLSCMLAIKQNTTKSRSIYADMDKKTKISTNTRVKQKTKDLVQITND